MLEILAYLLGDGRAFFVILLILVLLGMGVSGKGNESILPSWVSWSSAFANFAFLSLVERGLQQAKSLLEYHPPLIFTAIMALLVYGAFSLTFIYTFFRFLALKEDALRKMKILLPLTPFAATLLHFLFTFFEMLQSGGSFSLSAYCERKELSGVFTVLFWTTFPWSIPFWLSGKLKTIWAGLERGGEITDLNNG